MRAKLIFPFLYQSYLLPKMTNLYFNQGTAMLALLLPLQLHEVQCLKIISFFFAIMPTAFSPLLAVSLLISCKPSTTSVPAVLVSKDNL